MKSNVSQQLHEIYLEHQPDLVFIECSGIAEPLAVVDACLTPVLAPITTIRSMLGIIDAKLYEKIETYPRDIQALFYEQLSYCSTLFVNKIDIADFNQVARLLRHLEVINRDANIQVGQWGELALNTLLNVKHLDAKQRGTLHHAINHQLIDTPRSQTKADFIERLTQLPQQVYRVKGFVRFTDSKLIHLVQYARRNRINTDSIQIRCSFVFGSYWKALRCYRVRLITLKIQHEIVLDCHISFY